MSKWQLLIRTNSVVVNFRRGPLELWRIQDWSVLSTSHSSNYARDRVFQTSSQHTKTTCRI